MKSLYLDCFSGVSGNMILGALLDLGVDAAEMCEELSKLDIGFLDLTRERVNRSGISGIHVEVKQEEGKRYRHLPEIVEKIRSAGINADVAEAAVRVFERLGRAEAKVHGVPIERIHFHEVGAVDTIVDIVGSCIGFAELGIEEFGVSRINTGNGTVKIEHGVYPVPPPAVQELLLGFPVYSGNVEKELTTPTGAAIIAEFFVYEEGRSITAEKVGYGAGTFNPKGHPNVLRAVLGRLEEKSENLILLETNLDDMDGESLGRFMELAIGKGALDCWFTPVQMKKNRPGHLVSLLVNRASLDEFTKLVYLETSSIGIRIRDVERDCLERSVEEIETEFGAVTVKIARLNGEIVNYKPEHDELSAIAELNGKTLHAVKKAVEAKCYQIFGEAHTLGRKEATG